MAYEKKRVALVTGSSRGIGLGIAIGLAQEGFDLIINRIQDDPFVTCSNALKVKEQVEGEGVRAEMCIADISSDEHGGLGMRRL